MKRVSTYKKRSKVFVSPFLRKLEPSERVLLFATAFGEIKPQDIRNPELKINSYVNALSALKGLYAAGFMELGRITHKGVQTYVVSDLGRAEASRLKRGFMEFFRSLPV